jgi:glycosyltransferase involved in cell wall biosynthesis
MSAESGSTSKRVLMSNLVDFARGEGDAGHQSALLANFSAMGHEVRMMTPARAGAAAAVARFGALALLTPSTTALGLPGSFDAVWQLPRIVMARLRWRLDTLYVRVTTLCFVQVLLARALGMRVVVEHNGWTASERRVRGGGAVMIALERWSQLAAARYAHRSRCVTDGLARLLVEGGVAREKIFVVGNGVDLDKFKVLAGDPPAHTRLRFGFIGLLNPWQGVATALAAFSEVQHELDAELWIAGDGPLAEQLRARASALHLSERVRFIGKVPAPQAPEIINQFDIALAPYTLGRNAEIGSSAIKVRDYAGCGRPVIAARLPGIVELEAAGWLFTHTPDDASDLAQVMRRVAALGREQLAHIGARARDYAEAHFDWRQIARSVIAEC